MALAVDGVELIIDIKPCKEPNVLNVNQPGALPVAIYGGGGIDILEIDPSTVTLEGEPTIDSKIKGDYLLVKFDAQDVIAALGDVSNGQIVALHLEGYTYGGDLFYGEDDVVILERGR